MTFIRYVRISIEAFVAYTPALALTQLHRQHLLLNHRLQAPCSDLDIKEYWRTLHAAGIDEARLASFDRSITQKPSFSKQQVPQLLKDLQAYLVTLCAVHGGLDLQSAALPVLGYSQVCIYNHYAWG